MSKANALDSLRALGNDPELLAVVLRNNDWNLAVEDVGVPDIVRDKITGSSPHCVYSKLRNKS